MKRRVCVFSIVTALCALGGPGRALDLADIPADAPDDAIMAPPAEIAEMAAWAGSGFESKPPQAAPDRVTLQVKRQDHNVMRLRQSIMESPIRLQGRAFAHGLGTHANSEIVVGLPRGAQRFKAMAGLDDNPVTRSSGKGSVQFVVEIGGKEAVRTATLHVGDEPVAIDVPIPAGTSQIVLKTDATADGTGWDHADWADAQVLAVQGRTWWLDQGDSGPILAPGGPPFSFVLGGKSSAQLLKDWPRTVESKPLPGKTVHQVAWTDPHSGLRVAAELAVYTRYPAADWVLRFENTGTNDSEIIADIQALDVSLRTSQADRPGMLHTLAGDDCSPRSFVPLDMPLAAGSALHLAPNGGRPSNGTFPFFNFEYDGRGLFAAIGWSGQWAAALERDRTGSTRLRAGMERTHLRLHPGESIRSPRILLMSWQGDRQAAHNRFRRLILFHYTPRQENRPLAVPIFWQGYDRYNAHPSWPTEAGQLHAAAVAAKAGCEFLWLDAAWFTGNFPNGVGNWFCKPAAFPHGLKPVSDACHKLGMKFIVWFEPERVAPGTAIAREHPEFVSGGTNGGLFKLDDPAARRWLADLLIARIRDFGMDWYRNDFNMDPLPFWRQNDPPERQGMTEIRYVEGHYALWDEIRASRPGLFIDNCASGGRRIDLETIQRFDRPLAERHGLHHGPR